MLLNTSIGRFVPGKVVVFCVSKAKPEILHFGERKVCRCILYHTQNQVTNDIATDAQLGGEAARRPGGRTVPGSNGAGNRR